jgi:hypothetical protein
MIMAREYKDSVQRQLEARVNKLPNIAKVTYYQEPTQADGLEYHAIVRQDSEYGIHIKHYRHIDDIFSFNVPPLECISYSDYMVDPKELEVILSR